jgi:hypothetical protein
VKFIITSISRSLANVGQNIVFSFYAILKRGRGKVRESGTS